MAKKNDTFKVLHTKKGMKKLLKNLYLLQLNYVSIGIHKNDNKTTSATKQKKEYKKIQSALRKLENRNKEKTSSSSSSGLDKTNNRGGKSSSKSSNFNLATLAYYLEQAVSWVQNETVKIQGVNGVITIWKGARLKRPARIFIRLFKLANVWNGLRMFVSTKIKYFYIKAGANSKEFWKSFGGKVKEEQQRIITSSSSAMNSDLTTQIKGKNHPLFDTGGLLNSINYKIEKNYDQGAKKIAKAQFLMQLDQEMGKLK